MNKRDFNVVGNEGTDNQELASPMSARKPYRGCAFWEPHPLRLLASLNTTE